MMGRASRADDLIVPTRKGTHRMVNRGLDQLHRDLELLGFRRRRQHDGRRTLISLLRSDGANEGPLRWCTHGPDGTIMDDYTTPTWEALCREVAKLQLTPFGGRPVTADEISKSVTLLSRFDPDMKKPLSLADLEAQKQRGVRDLNPWPPA